MIQIKFEYPPNYDKIAAAFPLEGQKPVFAYAPSIYNPHRVSFGPEIIAHERVHISRQWLEPEKWWDLYIKDENFRLAEEILAHIAEYKFLAEQPGVPRNRRRVLLAYTAKRLAAPLYGYSPPLSTERAMRFMKVGMKEHKIS